MSDHDAKKTGEMPQVKLEELRKTIRLHDYWYYVKNQPKISDDAYDALFRELNDLEAQFPDCITPDSPTQRVGAPPLDQFQKVRHEYPLLSLDSQLDVEEVRVFDRRVHRELGIDTLQYTVEPKFDGLSVELVYDHGLFVRGSTRGDGVTGEDVTTNLRTIRSLPLALLPHFPIPSYVVVRGEVYMPLKEFHELNKQLTEKGEEIFANPRNAASGSLRQLDSGITASRPLAITCYEMRSRHEHLQGSHWDSVSKLGEWGLPIPQHRRRCDSIEDAIAFHTEMAEIRDHLPFEIDGIVIKVDCYEWQQTLGEKSRSPRWAIAFKFPPRREITKIHQIVVSVGRTGALTPIALLNPVEVGGVTISRATLHNVEEVARKDVRAGDMVKVERAGDVIPDIVERVPVPGETREAPFLAPTACPVCHSAVIREGPILYCSVQTVCSAQLKGELEHFASRNALDIQGFGKKTVAQLVERGLVKDLSDIFTLTKEQILGLEGFAERSATQLLEAIAQRKSVALPRFLFGLGIHHVGAHIAQILANHYRSLEQLMAAKREELEQIHGIGSEIAAAIETFFQETRNLTVLNRMKDYGITVTAEPTRTGTSAGLLEGKRFVLTGGLDGLTREEAKGKIQALGGHVTSSVSRNTDYVVAGKDPGSKLSQAARLKIRILNEDEFKELLQE